MARVLVADDEADIRSLVRVSLELDGHDVVEATDGIEALRAMGPPAPDVVVLDVTMPRLDGWEVLVRLKTKGPTASTVPVILLTALDAEVDRIRGGIEGAVRYVTKPFDPDHLRAEVTRALDEPEPASRREAARRALERLAVLERGGPPAAGGTPVAHPHLTRLGPKLDTGPARSKPRRFTAEQLASLSERQRELVAAVGRTASVLAAAEDLGVSRSNVYASLRRIARRLNVATVTELVAMARQGSADAGD